jgi:RNA polymerase sigma-70 factor (ECF subfamily)
VPLLVAHGDAMRRLARAIVYDEHLSEDVAQEAARIALASPAPLGWPAWAWLAGIVRNVARNTLRGERRRRVREGSGECREASAVRDAEFPLARIERVEAQRRVVDAVLGLDEPYRAVIIGRYFDGLSVDALALRLSTPRETVRTRLRRGVERLRDELDAKSRPGVPGWLAAFSESDVARSGGPSANVVRHLLEGAVMRKVESVVLAVLLGALGWTTWRVHALSGEVDRLARRPAPIALVAPDSVASAEAATLHPAPITIADPSSADFARRLGALEKRLDAMSTKGSDASSLPPELESALAELHSARTSANETAGIAVSRNATSAQAQFQQSARSDADNDGTGEYGGFLEMSGALAGRMAAPLNPPVLSSAFRTLTPAGEVVRNGYVFRLYLPDARGAGVGEPVGGFTPGVVDANLSETTWCMYAWPVTYGKTGRRTFFTNQGGDVLATDAPTYSGSGNGPPPDAAFKERGRITGAVAIGAAGSDGNEWKQVN